MTVTMVVVLNVLLDFGLDRSKEASQLIVAYL